MTAEEKLHIARFVDLAGDKIHGGYHSPEAGYQFSDDSAEAPAHLPPQSPLSRTDSLEQINADVKSCTACALCKTRTNTVPGEGSENPLVLVIGEGPGADEDASGRPFVGKAGQLLDKMLEAIDLSRESNCYIANVVKCRPPENRDPLPEEKEACLPFLERQINLLKPTLLLCVGRIAAQTLLNTGEPLGKLRGSFHVPALASASSIPLFVTYHPSARLRNPELKRPAWEDLKKLGAKIAETGSGPAEEGSGVNGAGGNPPGGE
jgi:DNA polymerase